MITHISRCLSVFYFIIFSIFRKIVFCVAAVDVIIVTFFILVDLVRFQYVLSCMLHLSYILHFIRGCICCRQFFFISFFVKFSTNFCLNGLALLQSQYVSFLLFFYIFSNSMKKSSLRELDRRGIQEPNYEQPKYLENRIWNLIFSVFANHRKILFRFQFKMRNKIKNNKQIAYSDVTIERQARLSELCHLEQRIDTDDSCSICTKTVHLTFVMHSNRIEKKEKRFCNASFTLLAQSVTRKTALQTR